MGYGLMLGNVINGGMMHDNKIFVKPIVLVGMMGAGKSVIGRMVAQKLGLLFVDADNEIEIAANRSIEEIFKHYGEEHFRDGECRVIERLLKNGPCVLATGGGAYIEDNTRNIIQKNGLSIWLNADFNILWERVSRRDHRPLLKADKPQEILKELIKNRYPIYDKADIEVKSENISKEAMRDRIIDAVIAFQNTN